MALYVSVKKRLSPRLSSRARLGSAINSPDPCDVRNENGGKLR
jgi:hypothetical protein